MGPRGLVATEGSEKSVLAQLPSRLKPFSLVTHTAAAGCDVVPREQAEELSTSVCSSSLNPR